MLAIPGVWDVHVPMHPSDVMFTKYNALYYGVLAFVHWLT
jgi:hypothetical protein